MLLSRASNCAYFLLFLFDWFIAIGLDNNVCHFLFCVAKLLVLPHSLRFGRCLTSIQYMIITNLVEPCAHK